MVPIQTGLEPGWSGSVMAKQLRTSPRTKGAQPALLLRVGAELAEDLHVAGVGCLAVDDIMAERALAELFADQGVLHAVEPQPAVRPRDVRGPEAERLDLLADSLRSGTSSEKGFDKSAGSSGRPSRTTRSRIAPRMPCMRSGIEKSIRGLAPGTMDRS